MIRSSCRPPVKMEAQSTANTNGPPDDATTRDAKKLMPANSTGPKGLVSKIKDFKLWPAMVSFVVGYKFGIKSALRQTAAATEVLVVPSSPLRTVALQATLIALITREVWRLIPTWIKRQIPLLRPKKVILEDLNDLSSISALSSKLQAVFTTIGDKLDDGAPEPAAAQASLLATLMMIAQIKEQIPAFRDAGYDDSGTAVDNPADELQGLDEVFEFADWAYDEFTDDNTLAKALALHKFSLLVRLWDMMLGGRRSRH